jgi:hypothetical protein
MKLKNSKVEPEATSAHDRSRMRTRFSLAMREFLFLFPLFMSQAPEAKRIEH